MTVCPRCAKTSLLQIEMTTRSDPVLVMSSCTRCEYRAWTADGSPVTREEVLRLTAGDPDLVIEPSPSRRRRPPTAQ